MMSMASARKRAEEFAAAADGYPTSVAVLDSETRAFLELVEQLRSLDTPAPDPRVAADLRSRLMDAARTELLASPVDRGVTDTPSRHLEPRRRRVMSVAASACIVAGSGMGVAAASQSALPGDALYPVKRGIEQVGLTIADSSAERGQEYVESADNRLTEVQGLALTRPDDPATPALISQTLDDFTAQAADGAGYLIRAYERESSEQSIVVLREFTDESATKLEALSEALPADARDELVAAAETLTNIDEAAREACPSCSELAPLTLPTELAALVHDADHNAAGAPSNPVAPAVPTLPAVPTAPAGPGTQGLESLPTLPTDFPTIGSTADPQQVPSQLVPSQQLPSQLLPPQQLPSQLLPPQQLPSQLLPPQQLPSQLLPPQQVPLGQVPAGQVPSQLLPPATAAGVGPTLAPPPALLPPPPNGLPVLQPTVQATSYQFTVPTVTGAPSTPGGDDLSGVSLPTAGLVNPSDAPIVVDPLEPVDPPVNPVPTGAPVVPDPTAIVTPPAVPTAPTITLPALP